MLATTGGALFDFGSKLCTQASMETGALTALVRLNNPDQPKDIVGSVAAWIPAVSAGGPSEASCAVSSAMTDTLVSLAEVIAAQASGSSAHAKKVLENAKTRLTACKRTLCQSINTAFASPSSFAADSVLRKLTQELIPKSKREYPTRDLF